MYIHVDKHLFPSSPRLDAEVSGYIPLWIWCKCPVGITRNTQQSPL